MKAIANLFLQAKHWQIFLLLCAAPTVIEVAAVGVVPERIGAWHDLVPGGFLLLGVTLLWLLCIVAWVGSMGLFFWSMVMPELRMKTPFFRLSLVYPVLYYPIFLFAVIPGIQIPVGVIVPLHLACMVCLFYPLYFTSRNLVLLETGKPVTFYEYSGPFFLLWFFPIGVWFIQPKVNRLYAERTGAMKHLKSRASS